MRFKKPRGVLIGIGYGAFVIAAALFFLVPIIFKEGFQYDGLQTVVAGITSLFSFNFVNVLYTALFVLFVLAVTGFIVFAILLIQKKHKIHLITWLFSLAFIFGSFVLVSSYFLADAKFNNADGKLIDLMLKTDGQVGGKILSSVALAFAVLANIILVVHMFVSLIALTVSDQMKEYEEKVVAEKTEEYKAKVDDFVANQEPIVIVKTAEPESGTLEERKAREEKFFKECIDSGYFTEYEEIEFNEPLEGFDEEPVCESSVVEEKTTFISRSSVHVGYTHD